MKPFFKHVTLAAAASVALANASFAKETGDDPATQLKLLQSSFAVAPESEVLPLSPGAMHATQGELWPWIIGITTLDLALASFFWGDYIPTITSPGGTCVNCTLSKKR